MINDKEQINVNRLNEIARLLHNEAVIKGFWDKPRELGTLLMLVVSELAEAMEADRTGRCASINAFENEICGMSIADNPSISDVVAHDAVFKNAFERNIKDSVQDEITDAFIRLFDLAGMLHMDLEKHITLKMQYNRMRQHMHDKKY